jgi:hypothetical protein
MAGVAQALHCTYSGFDIATSFRPQRLSPTPDRRSTRSCPMTHNAAVPSSGQLRERAARRTAADDALLREAEAQRALAELFPHLQPAALRAIQSLFPLARRGDLKPQEPISH